MGKGSHQRFQFPTEVRRKSCSAVVRGKEMKFGLSETISSQLILCYNHTLSLHMNSITSERLHTHTSQCSVSEVCVYCHSKVKMNGQSEQEASVPPRRHRHVTQNQVKGQIVVNCMVKGLPLREVTLSLALFLGPKAGWSCSCSWAAFTAFSRPINQIATCVLICEWAK